jgi:hypothetical protein
MREIEARLKAATPGPFVRQPYDENIGGIPIIATELGGLVGAALCWPTEIDTSGSSRVTANAELWLHAPTDIAFLLSELSRLRSVPSSVDEGVRKALIHARQVLCCCQDAAEAREILPLLNEIDSALSRAAEASPRPAVRSEALRVVAEQSEEEYLWFIAKTPGEEILQIALRRLHAAVEGKSQEECAIAALSELARRMGGK